MKNNKLLFIDEQVVKQISSRSEFGLDRSGRMAMLLRNRGLRSFLGLLAETVFPKLLSKVVVRECNYDLIWRMISTRILEFKTFIRYNEKVPPSWSQLVLQTQRKLLEAGQFIESKEALVRECEEKHWEAINSGAGLVRNLSADDRDFFFNSFTETESALIESRKSLADLRQSFRLDYALAKFCLGDALDQGQGLTLFIGKSHAQVHIRRQQLTAA
jgi:hypothetical protein